MARLTWVKQKTKSDRNGADVRVKRRYDVDVTAYVCQLHTVNYIFLFFFFGFFKLSVSLFWNKLSLFITSECYIRYIYYTLPKTVWAKVATLIHDATTKCVFMEVNLLAPNSGERQEELEEADCTGWVATFSSEFTGTEADCCWPLAKGHCWISPLEFLTDGWCGGRFGLSFIFSWYLLISDDTAIR